MLNVTTGPFVHICQDNLRAGKYTNKYLTIAQTNISGDNLRAGKYTNMSLLSLWHLYPLTYDLKIVFKYFDEVQQRVNNATATNFVCQVWSV